MLSVCTGQVTHALLTRPPLTPKGSLDLHVLGTPPAFILSQDQTLMLKVCLPVLHLAYCFWFKDLHLFRSQFLESFSDPQY